MKKIFLLAAVLVSMAANAQQFGVKGGLALTTVGGAKNPKDNKAMAVYEAGVLYKADLGSGFAIQPALAYQLQGAELKQSNDVLTKTGFVELSLGAQWGPDLQVIRPFVFVEPFVGYGVTGEETLHISGTTTTADTINQALQKDAKNKFEYGVGAGLGIEFAGHFQLSCQVFQNLGKLYKAEELDNGTLTHIKASYTNLSNYQGIKFTLGFLF